MSLPQIKLFCTDIDGTLLNADRWLSEETVSAFAKANLPIILASSRPPQAMHYLQEGLGILGQSLIAFNGGLIIDKSGNIIGDSSFSTEVLEELTKHHSQNHYNLSIYSHDCWFTDREDDWSLREINNTRAIPIYQPASESLIFLRNKASGIHKLMCMGPPEELDGLITFLEPKFGKKVHFYRSKDTYLEITPKNIDKARALKELLAVEFDFGMKHVMAFGDNHNDVELISHAGYGVAVKNATNELTSIADYVSPFTNKENAVAMTIESYLSSKQ